MTILDTMRQALEDICGAKLCEINSMSSRGEMLRLMDKASAALRLAIEQIEQAEQQEPMEDTLYGWLYEDKDGFRQFTKTTDFCMPVLELHRGMAAANPKNKLTPLYTAPPQRQSLTDEQLAAIYAEKPRYHYPPICSTDIEFARAIEAAHGIGGEA